MLAGGVVASVVVLVPICYIVVRATDQGWAVFRATLWRERTLDLVSRSIWLATVVTAVCVVIGVGAAWLVTSTDVVGRRFWRVALAMPLAIPSYVAAWAWIDWRPSLAGFRGAAVVLVAISYPYVYLPVLAAMARIDPTIAEVARACGRRPLRVFVTVTLPQIRVAVIGGAMLVFLYAISEFGAVSIMRYETLTKVIYTAYRASFDRTPAAVLGCVLVAVTLIPLWAAVRFSANTRAAAIGSGARRTPSIVSLSWFRWVAPIVPLTLVGFAIGVPTGNVIRWVRRGSSSSPWGEVVDAALSTAWIATLAALATVALAFPVAMLSARYPGRAGRAVTTVAYAGHALPGIVVALALVFFGVRWAQPIYQRLPMLILAYVVLFLSLAIGSVHSSLSQSSPGIEEAARACGRTVGGVWRTVTLPLAAPGLGVAATMVFIAVMKELPATLLLRPIGTDTLATRLWSATDAFSYAAAAPYAAALLLVASVPTALLTRAGLRGDR